MGGSASCPLFRRTRSPRLLSYGADHAHYDCADAIGAGRGSAAGARDDIVAAVDLLFTGF